MNDDVHSLLAELKTNGWWNASIARAMGLTVNAIEKWEAGDRNISRSHLILLNQLTKQKPPKRRHTKVRRRKEVTP